MVFNSMLEVSFLCSYGLAEMAGGDESRQLPTKIYA